jgi:hypothetical protein
MKKYFVASLLTLITATSCSDFLEKTPYDRKVVENFYTTPTDAFQGLVSTYNVLQWDGWGNILLVSEVASDNCFAGTGTSDDGNTQRIERYQSGTNLHANPWTKYYSGIFRANVVISNLDNVDWGTQPELRTQYEAEARFLRAYYYFDLIRYFGYVPLVTKPLTPSEAYVTQADASEVYALIAEDLLFASENLPAVKFQEVTTDNFGRATRWAAKSLLTRVFLFYTGYYGQSDLAGVVTKGQVQTHIEDVIENSGHALVTGTNGFRKLWRAASFLSNDFIGEDNIETVFAIKYTYKGASWDAVNAAGSSSGYLDSRNGTNGNKWQKFIAVRSQQSPYAGGWGFCTVNPTLFNSYNSDDRRRNASIIDIEDEIPAFDETDQRQYTGYAMKKFMPTVDANGKPTVENLGGDTQLSGFDDLPVIRFADVLLMASELFLDTDIGKAQSYFDQVRARAFEEDFGDNEVTLVAGQGGLNAIMEERRLEFAFEGIRYWDILRQGLTKAKEIIDNPTGDDFNIDFKVATGGFFEIPQTQISLSNGALQQNQGY